MALQQLCGLHKQVYEWTKVCLPYAHSHHFLVVLALQLLIVHLQLLLLRQHLLVLAARLHPTTTSPGTKVTRRSDTV